MPRYRCTPGAACGSTARRTPPLAACRPAPIAAPTTESAVRGRLDLRHDARLKALYLDNESYDGYRRDQDVFGPGVTTEDNLAVIVDYARGATLSYALNAHSPWEGYRIAVNGDQGRAELEVVERAAVLVDADGNVVVDPSAQPESAARTGGQRLTLQRHWEAAQDVKIEEGTGGHGGGDALLLADVFRGAGR